MHVMLEPEEIALRGLLEIRAKRAPHILNLVECLRLGRAFADPARRPDRRDWHRIDTMLRASTAAAELDVAAGTYLEAFRTIEQLAELTDQARHQMWLSIFPAIGRALRATERCEQIVAVEPEMAGTAPLRAMTMLVTCLAIDPMAPIDAVRTALFDEMVRGADPRHRHRVREGCLRWIAAIDRRGRRPN